MSASPLQSVAELIRRAIDADGVPPFADQSLIDVSTGARQLLLVDGGVAIFNDTEAEIVIDPSLRRHGLGFHLLERVLAKTAWDVAVWAHGNHPGAATLAAAFGLVPTRTLLQFRADVRPEASSHRLTPFRPTIDDTAWLDLNARAFASHPEQGALTAPDLEARFAEDWFDPADFLMLWEDEELIGFCWLKIDGTIGEFYAVGVSPSRQGAGVGRVLMNAGFARLRERGIHTASLYVEADNAPAIALYRRFGFTDHTIDVQYSRSS